MDSLDHIDDPFKSNIGYADPVPPILPILALNADGASSIMSQNIRRLRHLIKANSLAITNGTVSIRQYQNALYKLMPRPLRQAP